MVAPLAFRTTKELGDRIEKAVRVTKLSKTTLVLAAVEAVVAAIERDGGIVVPVSFLQPARVPTLLPPGADQLTDPTSLIAGAKARQAPIPADGSGRRAGTGTGTGAGV